MSGSVVADFVAEALYAGARGDEPTQARVLLSEDRLVLASDEGRTAIDLEDVFDVVVSKIPEDLDSFFDQSVLVAYSEGSNRQTALIRGEHDRIDRFALFLYKAIFRGSTAEVRHPARAGGRVLDPSLQSVRVVPTEDSVRLRNDDLDLTIVLDDVVEIENRRRDVEGVERPMLSVRHRRDGEVATTEIYHESANRLNVLSRHLRSEYYRAGEILDEVEADEQEQRALVALYAGVAPVRLAGVLAPEESPDGARSSNADEQSVDVEALLVELAGKGLLEDPDGGALTHEGALVAVHRIQDVEE